MVRRTLGDEVWGRKAARLPREGVLLVSTDLQGHRGDYERMKALYFREKEAGANPILLFTGDLVHGPGADLQAPGMWPEHLGAPYVDESAEILRDLEALTRTERVVSLLGNHEHAHVGGPMVSKFHPDEAAVLEEKLGEDCVRMRSFMATFPLIAVAPCGVVFSHGAPRGTEASLEAFERLDYRGYELASIDDMYERGTIGALLWARAAPREAARALLDATRINGRPNGLVVFGHDVVPEGFERIGAEQICVSTSFGVREERKTYLRLDLGAHYESTAELRVGTEILPLVP